MLDVEQGWPRTGPRQAVEIPDSSRSNRGEQDVVLMIGSECLQRRFPLLVRPTAIDPYKLEAIYVESHFDKIQHFGP